MGNSCLYVQNLSPTLRKHGVAPGEKRLSVVGRDGLREHLLRLGARVSVVWGRAYEDGKCDVVSREYFPSCQ